jgi:hypothetical protein
MRVPSILELKHKNYKSFLILVQLGPGFSVVKDARNALTKTPSTSMPPLKNSRRTLKVVNSSNTVKVLY